MSTLGPNLGVMIDAVAGEAHPNEFRKLLRAFDCLVGGVRVKSATTTAQPPIPSNGDRYIIPTGATGADWAGKTTGTIAYYSTRLTTTSAGAETTVAGWEFYAPTPPMFAYVEDTGLTLKYLLAGWETATTLLGESAATSYRGDRGKTAYDHSQASGNAHSMTPAQLGAAAAAGSSSQDFAAKNLTASGYFGLGTCTLATLASVPTGEGREIFVTDALSPIWEGIICDGTATVYRPSPWAPPAGAILTLETWAGRQRLYSTARTNVAIYSDQFDVASWTKLQNGSGVAPVVTANYGTAPDGTTTADRIVFDVGSGTTSNDYSLIRQSTGISSMGYRSVWMRSTSGTQYVTLLLTTNFSEVTLTESWQRFAWVVGSSSPYIGIVKSGSFATKTADILAWRADLKDSSTLSSSIATTSAAVTVTDYTVDATTGAVTLASPPPAGARLQWNVLGCPAIYRSGAWRRSNSTPVTS